MFIIKYVHHEKEVSVREDLKGKHRSYCLCWHCQLFDLYDKEKNCPIANKLYKICCENNIVTPVFECPNFLRKG